MPPPVAVHPLGDLVAAPALAAVYGNRGDLHAGGDRIVRGWQGRRWIACVLELRGRRHGFLPPRGYTGLLFRDEATALAAGHRPCAECRREDFEAYREAWARAHGGGRPDVDTMDRALHAERLLPGARPRAGLTAARPLPPVPVDAALPDGAIVVAPDGDLLVAAGGALRRWAFGPLGPPAAPSGALRLVTPAASVAVLRAGYRPALVPLVAGA
ncbi:MAG TPA: hypothetical protein VF533_22875 [Solirubrobacteraceae bacterium]